VGGDPVNLLAIESATSLVGAALLADSGAAAERSHQEGRMHAESLAPAIEEVCALSGLTVGDVEAIAVDVGPGLFTGLRVGVATAKALAQGLGIGVLAVGSLDILAAGAMAEAGSHQARTVVVVVDARRGEVFTSRYRFDPAPSDSGDVLDPAPARQSSPQLVTPDALIRSLTGLGGGAGERVLIVGDGAVRYRHLMADARAGDLDLVERVSSPSPLTLARLARRRLEAGAEPARPAEVVPDYRRDADARINWEQRIPPTRASGRARGR
jgi:tRNA threonylcarbamoyladenosine biosynthesis protein TsaB